MGSRRGFYGGKMSKILIEVLADYLKPQKDFTSLTVMNYSGRIGKLTTNFLKVEGLGHGCFILIQQLYHLHSLPT